MTTDYTHTDNNKIIKLAHNLMKDVAQIKNYDPKKRVEYHKMFANSGKYQYLYEKYQAIYMGILDKFITGSNFNVLIHMLQQRHEFKSGKTNLKETSQNVSENLQKVFKPDFNFQK